MAKPKRRRLEIKRKPKRAKTKWDYLIYAILTVGAAIMLLPLIYMVSTAFKPAKELLLYPPRFIVHHPTMKNFVDLLFVMGTTRTPFLRYIFNSVFTSTIVVAGVIIFSTLAAYPLAKHKFPGVNIIFGIIVSSLMVSAHVTTIPRYLIIYKLNWINSFKALTIPLLASSYGLFLMKQFIEPIPNAMLEAAKMDGASEVKVFKHVILPLCKPAWATLAIFTFISTWNDYFTPLIMTTMDKMKTLPLIMMSISDGVNFARMGAASASTFVLTAPVIVIYLIFQRYVVETMSYSGMKG